MTKLEIPLEGILNAVFHSTHSVPDAMKANLDYLIGQAEEESRHAVSEYPDDTSIRKSWENVHQHLKAAKEAVL